MSQHRKTMERMETLRKSLFFRGLPESPLAAIAAAGTERSLEAGEVLFHENGPPLGMLAVLRGAVRVYKMDARGRELTLGVERAGGTVAELPVFDGGNYPATAEATENGTLVLIVPRERFLAVMACYPDVAAQALRALSIRMRRVLHMLEVQALHTVRARLAAYLLEEAGGRLEFPLLETNDQIAGRLGTVREVVSRTLSSFRQGGAIEMNRRTLRIRSEDVLRRIASD